MSDTSTPARVEKMKAGKIVVCLILLLYLLAVGGFAVYIIVVNFPTIVDSELTFPNINEAAEKPIIEPFGTVGSISNAMLILVLMAGIAGSFIHAAQSLGSYLGNRRFFLSWTTWYILRPWIGGVLGISIYLVLKAGLVSNIESLNPYGAIGIGLLGGWFSKVTTDKLREVFETLFKTTDDKERDDKLKADDTTGETE